MSFTPRQGGHQSLFLFHREIADATVVQLNFRTLRQGLVSIRSLSTAIVRILERSSISRFTEAGLLSFPIRVFPSRRSFLNFSIENGVISSRRFLPRLPQMRRR